MGRGAAPVLVPMLPAQGRTDPNTYSDAGQDQDPQHIQEEGTTVLHRQDLPELKHGFFAAAYAYRSSERSFYDAPTMPEPDLRPRRTPQGYAAGEGDYRI